MTGEGLLKAENLRMMIHDTEINRLLAQMEVYEPPLVGKWITEDEV